jgi:hypothetical protein
MSRHAKRADANQPEIVKALRKAGVTVEIIGRPVDLACRLPSYPPGMFKLLELKSGKRKRKDQPEQDEFMAAHGVPRVETAEQAIEAVLGNPKPVEYGCHCDLENMPEGYKPDACVMDYGDLAGCVYARALQREGKSKAECEYWRPIDASRIGL